MKNDDLTCLEKLVTRDLEVLDYPKRDWITERFTREGQPIAQVLIVGAGQSGLAIAFGLRRERITNVLIIDENPAGRAGPWRNFARMPNLRTPKYLTGPDLGVPSLTMRRFYEAKYGEEAWQKLSFVPTESWAEYLDWFQGVLDLPVVSQAHVRSIEWQEAEKCFRVECMLKESENKSFFAEKVVLATGIDGGGAWTIPDLVSGNLPPSVYCHTRDPIDFDKLSGKCIAVLGAAASAFDSAIACLNSKAQSVHLFCRREALPSINPYRWAEFVGFLNHHADLSDELKWRFMQRFLSTGQLPPRDTYLRATSFPNFHVLQNSPVSELSFENGLIRLVTPLGEYNFDYLIVGTGLKTDLSLRPELENVYPHFKLWGDVYDRIWGEPSEDLAAHPYLSEDFSFVPKTSDAGSQFVRSIFDYNFSCLLSSGLGGASISGMKYSVPKLVKGITRQFYVDNAAHYLKRLCEFDEREF